MSGTQDQGTTQPESAPDLRSVISSAWEDNEKAAGGQETPSESTRDAAGGQESDAQRDARVARERDAAGRFVSKDAARVAEATPAQVEPAKAAGDAAAPPPGGYPSSWSAAERAHWDTLPEGAKAAVLRREKDFEAYRAQFENDDAKQIKDVLKPYSEKLRAAGMSASQAISTLVGWQARLDQDPVQGIDALAKSYGIDLRKTFGAATTENTSQTSQPGAAQPPAAMPEWAQKLQREVQSVHQTTVNQQMAQAAAQLEAFAKDPANPYFTEVRGQMGAFIKAGIATDLKSAYDAAVYANPETRAKAIDDQNRARDAERNTKAAQEAAAAKAKAVSVKGSPVPGSVAKGSPKSVRAALLDAMGGE